MEDSGQRVKISSYRMNKLWEYNVQHADYSYYIVYLKVDKGADIKCSHHQKSKSNYVG